VRACKKDTTHTERVREMRQLGLDVIDTSWSQGRLLDCIAQHRGTGKAVFVEINNDARGKLTTSEAEFTRQHAHCFIVRTREDVVALWEELRR